MDSQLQAGTLCDQLSAFGSRGCVTPVLQCLRLTDYRQKQCLQSMAT